MKLSKWQQRTIDEMKRSNNISHEKPFYPYNKWETGICEKLVEKGLCLGNRLNGYWIKGIK